VKSVLGAEEFYGRHGFLIVGPLHHQTRCDHS
jgi:hypothetical protein